MENVLITGIVIGLITDWLVTDWAILQTWDFFRRRPFNCTMCMGFWFGLISVPLFYTGVEWFLLPPLSSAAAVLSNNFKYN